MDSDQSLQDTKQIKKTNVYLDIFKKFNCFTKEMTLYNFEIFSRTEKNILR